MKPLIVGRIKEIERLEKYMKSDRSEFIAVYGRRRVGKTFLIKELFDHRFTFRLTGKENARLYEQLMNFSYAMSDYFGEEHVPDSWTEAFHTLSKAIERKPAGTKIIFIDELPWFDTPKANFISALEYFWNGWACYRTDIKLIVCGSATSWMLNKLINARGGLHNRVTHQMRISPFTLKETEQYFRHYGFNYERAEIIDAYMAVGGVAYYLSLFEQDKSVAQNLQALCFTEGGEIMDEFDRLYRSLFKQADFHLSIIQALSLVGKGMTRLDLISKNKLPNNGKLTNILKELEMCELIRSYIPFGKTKKDKLYQLIDPFSLFHLRFIKGNRHFEQDHWLHLIGTGEYHAWCGYAFEIVCLHHITQIVNGLGIGGILHTPCSWIYRPTEAVRGNENSDEDLKRGAQIDLLIDRNDKAITICEMKYAENEYEISKAYDKLVQDRLRTFRKVTKTTKTLALAYVTPQGLHDNMYARKVPLQITAEHLFE